MPLRTSGPQEMGTTFYEGCFVKPPGLQVYATTASDGCSRPPVGSSSSSWSPPNARMPPRGLAVATPPPSGDDAPPSIRARCWSLTARAGTPYPAYAYRTAEPEGGTPSQNRGAPGAVLPGPPVVPRARPPSVRILVRHLPSTHPPSALALLRDLGSVGPRRHTRRSDRPR